VRLTKADQDYFSKKLLTDFSAETNKMARELMQMHGLVLAGKLDEAEKLLSEFQKQFPNIAASYVLSASIENQRGKRDSARRYLMRANQIDPNDPVVLRMLGATQ
jgi:Flp pilus assembly protein TadD